MPGQITEVTKQVTPSVVEVKIGGQRNTVDVERLSPVEEGRENYGPSGKKQLTISTDSHNWKERLRPQPTNKKDFNEGDV